MTAAKAPFATRFASFVIAFLGALAAAGCIAQQEALIELDSFPKAKLEIRSGKQTRRFDIWIAETAEQQRQGLMFVHHRPERRGMLFIAAKPRVFKVWMRNTSACFSAPPLRML
jgi:Uncharacterized ACR, COG1430